MIEHIEIEGFKSLRKVSLDLGAFNLFIGANASGKSNFFDALRVLQGIGYGFTLDEIFNGKPKGAASETWEMIRGGSANAATVDRQTGSSSSEMRLADRLSRDVISNEIPRYDITITGNPLAVRHESLYSGVSLDFDTSRCEPASFVRSQPVLTQPLDGPDVMAGHRTPFSMPRAFCRGVLRDAQFLNPRPAVLREYSTATSAQRMGEQGENFAALVRRIMSSKSTAEAYMSWLRGLTPCEFDDVITLQGAMQDYVFALRKNVKDFPASILSDGTLRFAALVAAFFQPDAPHLLAIEELENGIHPSRLHTLVELLKSQSGNPLPQTFATTHSPLVLAWLDEADYKTTFLCQKNEESGETTITPLSEVPRFLELTHNRHAPELFAEGWMENAL